MHYLGILAACLTTGSFIPQAIKTVRTRDTSGISLTMYLILEVGTICWSVYGYALDLPPVLVANVITGLLAAVIIVLKLRERPGVESSPDTE